MGVFFIRHDSAFDTLCDLLQAVGGAQLLRAGERQPQQHTEGVSPGPPES